MRLGLLNPATIPVLVLAVCVAGVSAQATGPATNPSARTWSQTVQAAADALMNSDASALEGLLSPSGVIREFAQDQPRTPERAILAMSESVRLGVHAYPATPSSLASDLANDLRSAGEVIPEQSRQHMIPPDEATARRADATAAQWINSVLRKADGESHPTGVILFWPGDRRSRVEGPGRRAVFVLIQGERQGDVFFIKQLVFGDPLETPR